MNCCCYEFVIELVGLVQVLIIDFLYVDMSQNQGDVQLNKKEGDEKKKKAKSTWHEIECDGSVKKNQGAGV